MADKIILRALLGCFFSAVVSFSRIVLRYRRRPELHLDSEVVLLFRFGRFLQPSVLEDVGLLLVSLQDHLRRHQVLNVLRQILTLAAIG